MVFAAFLIITGVLGAMLFADWPAGFNTPQLSSKKINRLENEHRRTLYDNQLKEWNSRNMMLPEKLRYLPPQPPTYV